MKQLLLGGARSGKSRLAQQLARQLQESRGRRVTYLATATAGDQEMIERIARHRAERPAEWDLIEEPLALAETITSFTSADCLLVDCLTLWLSNQMMEGAVDNHLERVRAKLTGAVAQASCDLVLVSNEVGQGIVPTDPLARQFRDHAGWLHQSLAEVCDRVVMIVAGLPQVLKGEPL